MGRLLWTQQEDAGPAPRYLAAMAFDSVNRCVVLFGGLASSGVVGGDTWQWSGEHWTQVADNGPLARTSHVMAYDENRQRIVLFGGLDLGTAPGNPLGDTWEWDGESWTQTADVGPSNRYGAALAYHAVRQRVILFGGWDAVLRNQTVGFGDTWEWDGSAWTQLDDAGPARYGHAMAYDIGRDRVVLFGGATNVSMGDTWEWSALAWTQVADFGPGARFNHAMAFDGSRVLVSSGWAGGPLHDVWDWNGRGWSFRQDMGPARRSNPALAWDHARSRVVLFGGLGPDNVPLGDTWELAESPLPTSG
jgi:hypothetical protein